MSKISDSVVDVFILGFFTSVMLLFLDNFFNLIFMFNDTYLYKTYIFLMLGVIILCGHQCIIIKREKLLKVKDE